MGRIAYEVSKIEGRTPIEDLFIPEGNDIPLSKLDDQEKLNYWCKGVICNRLKQYILESRL